MSAGPAGGRAGFMVAAASLLLALVRRRRATR
jgi:MYXO-CTERM domain-containing protein